MEYFKNTVKNSVLTIVKFKISQMKIDAAIA